MMNGVPYSGICHGATTVLPAPSFVGKAGPRIKITYIFNFFFNVSVRGTAERIIGEILGGGGWFVFIIFSSGWLKTNYFTCLFV